MQLSDTQSLILSKAAQHEARLATAPRTLPAAARNAVFRSLLMNNLLTEINAPREYVGLAWQQDEEGTAVVARITDEGLRAIGIDPNEGDTAPTVAPAAGPAPQDAPAAEAGQGGALAVDLALLEQALATPLPAPRSGSSWPGMTKRTSATTSPMPSMQSTPSEPRWPASLPARRAMPPRRASRAGAPSRRRC